MDHLLIRNFGFFFIESKNLIPKTALENPKTIFQCTMNVGLVVGFIPCILGWFKKTQFCGNRLLFHFLNLYVEKNSREGCGLYDDI